MIFTCKNCEGNMVYSPEKKAMICPFCEGEGSQEMRHVNHDSLTRFCPNCGGEIQLGEHDSALQCPYCDNFIIEDPRIEGEFTPDYVIPFKLGKESCKATIREHFKTFKFAPTDFLSEVRLNTMQGWYVPFWFFDYNTNCIFKGEGTKVKTWTSGNTRYTEHSIYAVERELKVSFNKIPADASDKMPDDIMDLMEPYDYTTMEKFNPEYMSGFYGEKYNMAAAQVEPRSNEKMQMVAKSHLRDSYSNSYSSVTANQESVLVNDTTTSYGLLPVWKYEYQYDGKTYPFYVNGQTGKVVGAAPVSKKKVLAYSVTFGGLIIAIGSLISAIGGLL